MSGETTYYVLKEKAVPEVLLKVMEAKRLLESGKVDSVQEATDTVGISRSSFCFSVAYNCLYEEDNNTKRLQKQPLCTDCRQNPRHLLWIFYIYKAKSQYLQYFEAFF